MAIPNTFRAINLLVVNDSINSQQQKFPVLFPPRLIIHQSPILNASPEMSSSPSKRVNLVRAASASAGKFYMNVAVYTNQLKLLFSISADCSKASVMILSVVAR